MADLQRSIPSMVDGLKPAQRKILFCSFKRNFTKETRVAQFCGYVSEHSAYHHGEKSIASTIVGMAQDFVGTNNINLLQPDGQFGTRNMGGKDAADARYIFTKLSSATRVLFPKDDDVLLDYSTDLKQKIEPTWYMPIIPTVLVNGCQGIGTERSSFIPNYNPREIVANIRRLLNGDSMVSMDPWYRNFKGTIEKTASKDGGSTYTITGVYEEVDETTIRITELPIRRWTEDYKNFLEALKTNSNTHYFERVCDYSDDRSVDFEIQLTEKNMRMARQEGFLKLLKLTTSISTTNMHLFDEKKLIKKYATPEQILEDFFVLRLQYYEKRKKVILENLEPELLKLENKVKFIHGVVSGEIIVINRKKSDLVQELRRRGFTPFPKNGKPVKAAVAGAVDSTEEESEESSDVHASDYDYLLSLAIATLTLEKVQKLCEERDKMQQQVEDLKKATPRSLWLRDLESLDSELDKLDMDDAEVEKEREARQKWRRGVEVGIAARRKHAPKKTTKKASESDTMDTGDNVVEVAKPKGRQGAKKKAPAAAPKKTTKKASESDTTDTSSPRDNVVEVAKPKGRQGAKKKAAAAAPKVEDDEMLDLAQRLAQYNFGSTSENTNKTAISLDDEKEVVEVAPAKAGRKTAAASKVAKPPPAPRKRALEASKKQQLATEVVEVMSPEKKVRKMNKKSSSALGRLGNTKNKDEEEEESVETVAVETASARPKRANRKQTRYALRGSVE